MKYLGTVIESGIFANLKKSEYIRAFEQLGITVKTIRQGSAVYYEEDVVDKICIIDKGSVCGEKTYADGEMHIIQLYEEENIFGLEAAVSKQKTSPVDYVCNEDSVIVFITISSILKSDYCKHILDVLMQKLADDNIKKMHKIEMLAERSLRERILIYFTVLRTKAGEDTFDVKMDREQLAQYLCVNRSALSNELNKMKKEGIIDFQKSKFRLLKTGGEPKE
ncbi:MAG: Crp/Fnr family transcriptional regulator [Bacillota bacterium]|nr:Crp/Fnr family transcriptional regulator [Bacillota bacterium]